MKPDKTEYSKAGVFGQVIAEATVSACLDFLEQRIVERTKQQGVQLNRKQIRSLRSQLQQVFHGKGTAASITIRGWRWWKNDDLEIEFTEEDQQDLDELTSRLIAEVPETLQDSLGPVSEVILRELKKSWSVYRRTRDKDLSGFRKRLDRVWGKGLSLLEMLVIIAVEVGGEMLEIESTQPTLASCHSRLHARACQIADEAITLMRYGFADGAMARWRTLHEVAVVMNFLSARGEEVAKKYVDHQVVESWRAAETYQRNCAALGQDPFSEEEMAELKEACTVTVQKYGREFRKSYGWAAAALRKERPTFADIECSVKLDHFRPYYKLASQGIHANPQGAFFRLGTLGEEVLLAGPSNAGIADPGHSVAISLYQATVFLVSERPSYDHLVAVKIMGRLTDEIGNALIRSHKEVEQMAHDQET